MRIRYYPESDMLNIDLSSAPATGDGEEISEGIVFLYDELDRLVGIEIEDASKRVDLKNITSEPANIVDDSGEPVEIYTVTGLAKEWGISPRTVQKTIQSMTEAGIPIGTREGSSYPIILKDTDIQKIQQWRKNHPRGRPKEQPLT